MRFISTIFLGIVFAACVNGQGVAPYLPLNTSLLLENEIERLATVANIPKLTKPYNVAVIFRGLDKIEQSHPQLYSRLMRALDPYTHNGVTHASARVNLSGDSPSPVPNDKGRTTDNQYLISTRAQWQVADWLGLYAGSEIADENKQLTGSVLAVGTSWAQLDLGYREHWYSPFQGHSHLIGTQAETMLSATLSNNIPINAWGTLFNYELFLAQMSEQPVLFNGEFTTGDKPLLAGVHLSFQPIEGWQLGVNRTFQFGGGNRDVDLDTLVKAFFDPNGADNTGRNLTSDEQLGNQIASFTSKMNFDTTIPFTINAELAGEDTAAGRNFQLGNTALSAGVYFPYLANDQLSLTYEYSTWQRLWYVNSLYQEGYTNEGFVLGHWALQVANQDQNAPAGSSHYMRAQWQFDFDHMLSAQLRQSEYDSDNYQSAWEADIEYAVPWQGQLFSVGLYYGENPMMKRSGKLGSE